MSALPDRAVMDWSMGSLTRRQHITLLAGQAIPAVLAICYGIAVWLTSDWLAHLALIFVFGGITSIALTELAIVILFYWPPRTTTRRIAGTIGLLGPYAFALFLFGYMGLYSGWYSVTEYHGIGKIINAVVWLAAGVRMAVVLGRISEHDRKWHGLFEGGLADQLVDISDENNSKPESDRE